MGGGTFLAKTDLAQLSYSFKNAKPARDTMSVPPFDRRQDVNSKTIHVAPAHYMTHSHKNSGSKTTVPGTSIGYELFGNALCK